MDLRGRFAAFAESFPDLPLYGRLAEAIAEDHEVPELLAAARPGQARPVLLFAAVHDLVLRDPRIELARWYSSVTAREALAEDDPWPTFRATCLEHRDSLEAVIARRATQTNEVNRAALLAPLLASAGADLDGLPISLIELGASAGLLLGLDRYRIDIGGVVVGDECSPVELAAEVRGGRRPELWGYPSSIAERVGIDADPVRLDDTEHVRWLQACLWPDQPWRIERFRAAVDQLRDDPPRLVRGDLIDELPGVIAACAPETHLVVFDTWVLTYVERGRRHEIAEILAGASSRRPVSWLSAEAPGVVPGIEPGSAPAAEGRENPDTVLGLRRWRDGDEQQSVVLGWAHPHGNWLSFDP